MAAKKPTKRYPFTVWVGRFPHYFNLLEKAESCARLYGVSVTVNKVSAK
ncbi:hypothetical protein ABT025_18555 [Streptomyces sp. NPDC002809]